VGCCHMFGFEFGVVAMVLFVVAMVVLVVAYTIK
jgi:hypothetical protein